LKTQGAFGRQAKKRKLNGINSGKKGRRTLTEKRERPSVPQQGRKNEKKTLNGPQEAKNRKKRKVSTQLREGDEGKSPFGPLGEIYVRIKNGREKKKVETRDVDSPAKTNQKIICKRKENETCVEERQQSLRPPLVNLKSHKKIRSTKE